MRRGGRYLRPRWRCQPRLLGLGRKGEMMKLCRSCQRTLPLEAFHRCTGTPSGRASWCKECKRAWRHTEAGLRYRRASKERWRVRNLHKSRGQLQVHRAIKRGILIKTDCSQCGSAVTVQGHHHNGYGDPLDVIWLCRPCHQAEHERSEVMPRDRLRLHTLQRP